MGLGMPKLPALSTKGKVGRAVLNGLASVRAQFDLATNKPIPIVYGRAEVRPRPFTFSVYQGSLYIAYLLCEGEIEEIESVSIDGNDISDPGELLSKAGADIEYFTGTSAQAASTLLAEAISGYSDTLQSIAYFVLKVPMGVVTGVPRPVVVVKGSKVYDPRLDSTVDGGSGSHRLDTPSTWEWSENPSLATSDFIYRYTARSVNWLSIMDAADANDETVGGVPRRTIGLVLDTSNSALNWIEGLRTYAGAFLSWDEGAAKLIPDRPSSSVKTFTDDDIIDGSFQLSLKSSGNVPTVVRVTYQDSSAFNWREFYQESLASGVSTGDTPRRESNITLPGVHNASQALREATERRLWAELADSEFSLVGFDECAEIEEGNVITVERKNLYGGSATFRVLQIEEIETSRFKLSGVGYSAGAYSDATVANPSFTDSAVGDPLNPPTVTGLTAVEELSFQQTGIQTSRLRISIDEVDDYPFLLQYVYRVYQGTDKIWEVGSREAEVVTSSLEQLLDGDPVDLQVRVLVQTAYTLGTAATYDVTIYGKVVGPTDVPYIDHEVIDGDKANFVWGAPAELDVKGYHIKTGVVGDDWEDGYTYDPMVQAQHLNAQQAPGPGIYRVFIKAVDFTGQESENAAYTDVEITGVPDPTELTVGQSYNSHVLNWDDPDYQKVTTQVWSASSNNRALATQIATVAGTSLGVPATGVAYYWVRNYHPTLGASEWYPGSATAGVTGGSPYSPPYDLLSVSSTFLRDAGERLLDRQ